MSARVVERTVFQSSDIVAHSGDVKRIRCRKVLLDYILYVPVNNFSLMSGMNQYSARVSVTTQ